jgi:hypothetical protein
MTELCFTNLDQATLSRAMQWPDATELPALSAYLNAECHFDEATCTLIMLNDMSKPANTDPEREPDIYVTAVNGREWMFDANFTDLLTERSREWGTDPEETTALRAALDDLASVHSTALQVSRADASSAAALAGDLANREHELAAQLAVTRMLRAQVVRGLVAVEPVTAEADSLEIAMRYSVDSFADLAVLVNEHRRLMGELA